MNANTEITVDSYAAVVAALHIGQPLTKQNTFWGLSMESAKMLCRNNPGLMCAHVNYMDDEFLIFKDGRFYTEEGYPVRDADWRIWATVPNLAHDGWHVFNQLT